MNKSALSALFTFKSQSPKFKLLLTMATAYHNLSEYDFNSVPNAENMKFGIVEMCIRDSHWDQLVHAEDWLLFEKNIGAYICIDEVALSRGELYLSLSLIHI